MCWCKRTQETTQAERSGEGLGRGGGVLRSLIQDPASPASGLRRITLLRACANRWATFRTWQLLEGLYSLLTIAWHIRYSPIGATSKSPGRLQREDQGGVRLAPAIRELAAGLRRGCRRGHTGRRGKLAHLRSGAQGIGAGSAHRVRRIYFGRSAPRGRAMAGDCRAGRSAPHPQRPTLCRSLVPRDDGSEVLRSTRDGRANSSY